MFAPSDITACVRGASPEGAGQMLDKVKSLQKQQLLVVQDAATVIWPKGKKGPKTKQAVNHAGMGAAFGVLSGKMSDYGIDDDFIKGVRHTPPLFSDYAIRSKHKVNSIQLANSL